MARKSKNTVTKGPQDVGSRDLAPIIQEIREMTTTTRVKCQNCLTRPTQCQWRRTDAPFEEVFKRARKYPIANLG